MKPNEQEPIKKKKWGEFIGIWDLVIV